MGGGYKFIKVPFSGTTYKEINNNLMTAFHHNSDLKIIIIGLDMGHFFDDKEKMRQELGDYPTYLYDDNIFNDVQYLFNRDVVFSRVYPMVRDNDHDGFKGGITTFDQYANWMKNKKFGKNKLYPDGVAEITPGHLKELSEEEKKKITENIRQNITSLANANPEVSFYCFFPPYSAGWWRDSVVKSRRILYQIQAEKTVIEELLKCSNIHLFSFNLLSEITTDLNNYRDKTHYGEWINSLILEFMHNGENRITKENYETYLDKEFLFYSTYDYTLMNNQIDYDDDYYPATLLADQKSN